MTRVGKKLNVVFAFLVLFSYPTLVFSYEKEVKEIASQYKISKQILEAIIEAESNGEVFARRYEPILHKKEQFKNKPKAYATSYGLTQIIYGYHFKKCNLSSPISLYIPIKNIECSAIILKHYYNQYGTLFQTIKAYNGTGRKAEEYARRVIKRAYQKSNGRQIYLFNNNIVKHNDLNSLY